VPKSIPMHGAFLAILVLQMNCFHVSLVLNTFLRGLYFQCSDLYNVTNNNHYHPMLQRPCSSYKELDLVIHYRHVFYIQYSHMHLKLSTVSSLVHSKLHFYRSDDGSITKPPSNNGLSLILLNGFIPLTTVIRLLMKV